MNSADIAKNTVATVQHIPLDLSSFLTTTGYVPNIKFQYLNESKQLSVLFSNSKSPNSATVTEKSQISGTAGLT